MSIPGDARSVAVRSYEQFFTSEFSRLVRYVHSFTADAAVAEDLASEAFAAAWRNWPTVSTMERPELWLRQVLRHKHTDLLRRKYSHRRAMSRLARYSETNPTVVVNETDDLLSKAVASLSRRQAQVIALMYYEDRPAEEVAQILAIKIDDVYKHHNRAKVRLRALLEQADE
jgi:RNA polymerase sigma factor (sigma-70 family)